MGRNIIFRCNVLLKQRIGKAGVKEAGEAVVLAKCIWGRIKSFVERKKSTAHAVAKEAVVFACGLGGVVQRGWMSKWPAMRGLGNVRGSCKERGSERAWRVLNA